MAPVRRELPALPKYPGSSGSSGSSTSTEMPGGRGPPLLSLPRPWVERVAQPVTDQIGGEHGGEKERTGEHRDPPGLLQPGLAAAHDAAPGRGPRRHAGAEER